SGLISDSNTVRIDFVCHHTQRQLVVFIRTMLPKLVDERVTRRKYGERLTQVRKLQCFSRITSLQSLRFEQEGMEEGSSVVVVPNARIHRHVVAVKPGDVGLQSLLIV